MGAHRLQAHRGGEDKPPKVTLGGPCMDNQHQGKTNRWGDTVMGAYAGLQRIPLQLRAPLSQERVHHMNTLKAHTPDPINHPVHYSKEASGMPVECIDIAENLPFCLGNAIKYIWRAGIKTDDASDDLAKAIWYLKREIARRSISGAPPKENNTRRENTGGENTRGENNTVDQTIRAEILARRSRPGARSRKTSGHTWSGGQGEEV